MPTKVYASGVKPPKSCLKDWQAADDRYVEAARERIKQLGYGGPYAGKEVRFPVGDGYARYLIMSLSPKVEVMWLEIGDAWQFQYISSMTAKDLRANADRITYLQEISKGQTEGNPHG